LVVAGELEGIGTSPDAYVNEMLEIKRKAYDLARRHLGRAAERRKREYDKGVREKTFKKGAWVWYFYPRRYRGKSPKWQRHYIGPFLITREIPPCNYVIQRSARSKPIVAHVDKLKEYYGVPPASWIAEESDLPVTVGCPVENSVPAAIPIGDEHVSVNLDESAESVTELIDNGKDRTEIQDQVSPNKKSREERVRADASPAGRRLRRPDQRRLPVRFL
jgi:hypothetical protein